MSGLFAGDMLPGGPLVGSCPCCRGPAKWYGKMTIPRGTSYQIMCQACELADCACNDRLWSEAA